MILNFKRTAQASRQIDKNLCFKTSFIHSLFDFNFQLAGATCSLGLAVRGRRTCTALASAMLIRFPRNLHWLLAVTRPTYTPNLIAISRVLINFDYN